MRNFTHTHTISNFKWFSGEAAVNSACSGKLGLGVHCTTTAKWDNCSVLLSGHSSSVPGIIQTWSKKFLIQKAHMKQGGLKKVQRDEGA